MRYFLEGGVPRELSVTAVTASAASGEFRFLAEFGLGWEDVRGPWDPWSRLPGGLISSLPKSRCGG